MKSGRRRTTARIYIYAIGKHTPFFNHEKQFEVPLTGTKNKDGNVT